MKQIVAYAILIIGLPNYIGLSMGGLLGASVAWICPDPLKERIVIPFFFQLLNGMASILSALVLFRLFGLTPGLSLPIISAVWITVYFFHYRQSQIIRWLSWLAGITIGWIMFRNLFRNL
jgi:pimeloyl-ACP methyl ester carboxylesterase